MTDTGSPLAQIYAFLANSSPGFNGPHTGFVSCLSLRVVSLWISVKDCWLESSLCGSACRRSMMTHILMIFYLQLFGPCIILTMLICLLSACERLQSDENWCQTKFLLCLIEMVPPPSLPQRIPLTGISKSQFIRRKVFRPRLNW